MTRFLTLVRRTTLLILAVATPVLVAVPARADVPEGWTGGESEQIDTLHALLILAGIPLLLFVLITIAVYVPALIRGEQLTPGGAPAIESQWFGGPRGGTKELGSTTESSDSDDTGGASGRW